MKENEMEFIGKITNQLTEERFKEDTFEGIGNMYKYKCKTMLHFTKQAHDFYKEKYDEVENLYINLIKNK